MLVLPKGLQMEQHVNARNGMTNHFNQEMEKILVANAKKDVYWILGKCKVEKHLGKDVVRPFLQACDEKPGLIKQTFVYQVDNRRGVKELLWVMHPGDLLSFPTLGKSIRVSNDKGVTILPPK